MVHDYRASVSAFVSLFIGIILLGGLLSPRMSSAEELVIVSPHWEGFRREFEEGFLRWMKKKNPKNDTMLRWMDLGGASDIVKTMVARADAGSPLPVDVIFGGGSDLFAELKKKNLLQQVSLSDEILSSFPADYNGNPLRDLDGYWFGVNLTSFGIAYNKKLMRILQVPEPKAFADLGAPSLRGWIGSADPRRSGSVRFIYELILQSYGWEKGWEAIYRISSNVRSFNNNSSQTPKELSTGEIFAGLLIDSYGLDVVEKFGEENIGFVAPEDVKTFFADPVAIGTYGNHKELGEKLH